MTFATLQQQRAYILLECISGSRAYNLQVPTLQYIEQLYATSDLPEHPAPGLAELC
ncbi:hypothetical protein ACDQ55_17070 [Chitinophaga sp. 30R24]|uniref:hypothetical protein n=1 Tax=Chitinophaga sp. 30R24 TaxID=3248838 RepID=UPI003B90F9EA